MFHAYSRTLMMLKKYIFGHTPACKAPLLGSVPESLGLPPRVIQESLVRLTSDDGNEPLSLVVNS